jgi:redox-sensitive bicupin YhaK (pirin superfamily)
MTLAPAKSPPPRLARAIVQRTRGRTHGPVTRLMSPSDLGAILKPFVFLDLFDHAGAPFEGPLHPHSGIATLTYVVEGAVSYVDPDNVKGTLPAGSVEWMQAGRGMWHGGGLVKPGRTRGFQLWIALPPELELGPTTSIYQSPEDVPQDGSARVLLGGYKSASSAIASPSSINYLAVRLKAGERWRYEPPMGHTVLWVAIASGVLSAPEELRRGDLAAFEPSSQAAEFEALTDTELVLGSAAPHDHDLVLGQYSVHTSPDALRDAEANIAAIRTRLVQEAVCRHQPPGSICKPDERCRIGQIMLSIPEFPSTENATDQRFLFGPSSIAHGHAHSSEG